MSHGRTQPCAEHLGSMSRGVPLGLAVVFGLLAVLAGCASDGSYRQWGTMQEALREGQTGPRIDLADASLNKNSYGVGALAGLRGEITIDGGTVWVSRTLSPDHVETSRGNAGRVPATMLFVADVPAWRRIEVTTPVAPADFDAFISEHVRESGRSSGPVPFRIEGTFEELRMHVIGGQCPIRARMLDIEMTHPAFELTIPNTRAVIVGIFAENAAGEISHMGSNTHMHVILEHDGETLTGHVEHVSILPGSVLQVPATR